MACPHCGSWYHEHWGCSEIKTKSAPPSLSDFSSSSNDKKSDLSEMSADDIVNAGQIIVGLGMGVGALAISAVVLTGSALKGIHNTTKAFLDYLDKRNGVVPHSKNSSWATGIMGAVFATAAGNYAYEDWKRNTYPAIYIVELKKAYTSFDKRFFYGSNPNKEKALKQAQDKCYESLPFLKRFTANCEKFVFVPAGKKACVIYGLETTGRLNVQIMQSDKYPSLSDMCQHLNIDSRKCVSENVYRRCNYT